MIFDQPSLLFYSIPEITLQTCFRQEASENSIPHKLLSMASKPFNEVIQPMRAYTGEIFFSYNRPH